MDVFLCNEKVHKYFSKKKKKEETEQEKKPFAIIFISCLCV